MRVCADVFPPLVPVGTQEAECWLLATDRIDPAGRAPLQREEVLVADEA
jgi:hypothetical protein